VNQTETTARICDQTSAVKDGVYMAHSVNFSSHVRLTPVAKKLATLRRRRLQPSFVTARVRTWSATNS